MGTITLEPLRWLERPSRVRIIGADTDPKAYFQVTSPRDIARMAIGRPVEEMPRIVGILSPAHHLVSAMALDRLFKADPPELAVNMREALLQAQFISNHLRKLYFFLSGSTDPFQSFSMRSGPERTSSQASLLNETTDCLALAQEAAAILGGRADHPVSAMAGGVGRFLKEPHYERLSEIAKRCMEFMRKPARLIRENILKASKTMDDLADLRFQPLPFVTANNGNGNLIVMNAEGKEEDQASVDKVFDKIGLRREPWSYEAFAYLKDKGWSSHEPETDGGLYFVGPLARLNSGNALQHPIAEEERQSLITTLGEFPHFSVAAAYWSILVELIQAAEKFSGLATQAKLTGPSIRTMPSERDEIGYAVLESPQGLIAHRYKINDLALVEEVEILDSSAQNNALLCLLVRKAVEKSLGRKERPEETKSRIEISLLPF
jgi:F420-non-reducing hydrogenase large subunit